MIIVKIRKWDVINNLEHTSTTWEIASDEGFENILESHVESNMLELLYSTIEIPKDVTYYVRAKRHFNSSGVDYWLKPVPVTNMEESYGNMLMQKDAQIQQPYLYVELDDVMSSNDKLLVRSSKFNSNVDQHVSTHWLVYDANGALLYASINDEENKTEIQIPNLPIFKTKTKLTFMCIHRGITGVESKPGFKKLSVSNDVNFEVGTPLTQVTALKDLVVRFKPLVPGDKVQILNVALTSIGNSKNVVKQWEYDPVKNYIVIPWHYLKTGMSYNLTVTSYAGGTNTKIIKHYPLTVESHDNNIIKDSNFKLKNEIINSFSPTERIPDGIYVESTAGNALLVPSGRHKKMIVYGYDSENNIVKSTKLFANGIELISSNIKDLIVKSVSRSLVLIDMYNEEGKPTFLVYTYDGNSDKYTLKHSIKRDDETKALGYTGSILQVSNTEFLYNPHGSEKLKKLNVETGEVITLTNIPLAGITNAVLIRCKDNRVLIGNGVDYKAVVYNVTRDEFTTGYSFGPNSFVNKKIKTVYLINGDTLMLNEEVTKHKDGNFESFSYSNSGFNIPRVNIGEVIPTSVFVLNNGYTVFTNTREDTGSKDSTDITYYQVYR